MRESKTRFISSIDRDIRTSGSKWQQYFSRLSLAHRAVEAPSGQAPARMMSAIAMLRQQPLNSDSASVEWMEVAHEDDASCGFLSWRFNDSLLLTRPV